MVMVVVGSVQAWSVTKIVLHMRSLFLTSSGSKIIAGFTNDMLAWILQYL